MPSAPSPPPPTSTLQDKEIKCTVPKATLVENGGKFLLADLEGDGLTNVVVTIDNNPLLNGHQQVRLGSSRPTQFGCRGLDASWSSKKYKKWLG